MREETTVTSHPAISGYTYSGEADMATYTAVVERCPDTGLYVGHVPGFPGAHSQGRTLDELNSNLREVIEMILEDGEPVLETEFVGTQLVSVG
jgi:predicted RNase H-like HicB family nuclease